jgi:thiamine kinase-like enzyme
MTDDVLVEVAGLLRRFHEAAASLDPRQIEGWATEWADPIGGPLVCHNDPYPENILFHEGRAVALIDFDLAAPGRPLWDVAVAAREWAPLSAPETRHDHPRHLDGVARLGRLVRVYGVDRDDASTLIDLVFMARQQSLAHIRGEIAAGNPTWVDNWRQTNGEQRAAADDAWLERHRNALVGAVTG